MTCGFNKRVLRKVGELLRQERHRRYHTLEKISEKTGIAPQILDFIETGAKGAKWKQIVELAAYYGKEIKFTLTDGIPPEYEEEEETSE